MGENEFSHPIGILSGFSDCRTPKSPSGRRSPLNSRFTENGDIRATGPAPAVRSPKIGMRLTKTKASTISPDALTIRIKSVAIGSLHRTDPDYRCDRSGTSADRDARSLTCIDGMRSEVPKSGASHRDVMPAFPFSAGGLSGSDTREEPDGREQIRGSALIMVDGHFFSPPPVLGRPRMLGAADMPIGCARTFDLYLRRCAVKLRKKRGNGGDAAAWGRLHAIAMNGEEITMLPGARSACVRAGGLCGRKTWPD
jgi:hypothetical protein